MKIILFALISVALQLCGGAYLLVDKANEPKHRSLDQILTNDQVEEIFRQANITTLPPYPPIDQNSTVTPAPNSTITPSDQTTQQPPTTPIPVPEQSHTIWSTLYFLLGLLAVFLLVLLCYICYRCYFATGEPEHPKDIVAHTPKTLPVDNQMQLKDPRQESAPAQGLDKKLSKITSKVKSKVGSRIGSKVSSKIRSKIGSRIESNLSSKISSKPNSTINSNIGSEHQSLIGSKVSTDAFSRIGSKIESRIGSRLSGTNVLSNVGSAVSLIRSDIGSKDGLNASRISSVRSSPSSTPRSPISGKSVSPK